MLTKLHRLIEKPKIFIPLYSSMTIGWWYFAVKTGLLDPTKVVG